MTNSTIDIELDILSSSFCLTNTKANDRFWIYFGIFVPVSLLIMFVSMKYACKLKMLGFCSILSLLIETATISSVLGSITYSLILFQRASKFVDYDCSFYEFTFPGSQTLYQVIDEESLPDIDILYIASISAGFIIFTGILILKLWLMKKAQELDEEFENQYTQEGYSCKQKCCRWLAAKIKYQWKKFWQIEKIGMNFLKIFLFIVGFSLCASLQPLYSIGNVYDEDYTKIVNDNCLCIERGVGTAITLYGGAITAMIAFPMMVFMGKAFHATCIDWAYKNKSCNSCAAWLFYRIYAEIIKWFMWVSAAILGVFVVASPFLLISARVADMYESVFISNETGGILSISQVITSIFFIEMLIQTFNNCGCRC